MTAVAGIHEVPPGEFATARGLFDSMTRLELTAAAVLDGESDGRLLVDDPRCPRSAFLTSPEGSYLVGDPDNHGFVAALTAFVWEDLLGSAGWTYVYATAEDPRWYERLREMAAPRDLITVGRRLYECRRLAIDWPAMVPDGFRVVPVDAALLDEPSLVVPEQLQGWIRGNWGSRERFLARGFGAATLHETSVVSWSLADCRSGHACEIGIQTRPAYRRRGLATVTAASAVEHALAGGFRVVGWHCDEDNLGSIGTAENVGFELLRRYQSAYFYGVEAEELAEKGWIAFRRGRPAEAADFLDRALALRPESSREQYLLAARAKAAIGDADAAVAYLRAAIERGWSNVEATEQCAEFDGLRASTAWAEIVALMRRAGEQTRKP